MHYRLKHCVIWVAFSLYSAFALADAPAQALTWPMQTGESIQDLARLFYPHHATMQQQFIRATIRLNQQTNVDLTAQTQFVQGSVIHIPDIQALSKRAQHKARSHRVAPQQVEPTDAPTPEAQAAIEDLTQRDAVFTSMLAALNTKLTQLQSLVDQVGTSLSQYVAQLNLYHAAQNLIAMQATTPSPATNNQQLVEASPAAPVEVAATQQPKPLQAAQSQANTAAPQAAQLSTPVEISMPSSFSNMLASLSTFKIVLLGTLGFAVLLLLSYFKWQDMRIKATTATNLKPLDKDAFSDSDTLFHLDPATLAAFKKKPDMPNAKTVDILSEVNYQQLDEKKESELLLAEAKIYVSLGKYDNAVWLLDNYIKVEPQLALQHWLYLLDIYRIANRKEAFLSCAQALHQQFNVVKPEWEQPYNAKITSLEDYDYIVNKVTQLWADCEKEAHQIASVKKYLDQLLTDNRDNTRGGFSMDVFEEILLLRDTLTTKEKLAETE